VTAFSTCLSVVSRSQACLSARTHPLPLLSVLLYKFLFIERSTFDRSLYILIFRMEVLCFDAQHLTLKIPLPQDREEGEGGKRRKRKKEKKKGGNQFELALPPCRFSTQLVSTALPFLVLCWNVK